MATSGHGIKILNSVSKTHPESYIAKSCGTTATLRQNKTFNDTLDHSSNSQANHSLVKREIKETKRESNSDVPTKINDGGYLSTFVEKSFKFFIRKQFLSKMKGILYEATPNIHADLHNSKTLYNSTTYDKSKSSYQHDYYTDEFIQSIGERSNSQLSRSSKSCEVLKLKEDKLEPNPIKSNDRISKFSSKSTSSLADVYDSSKNNPPTTDKPYECNQQSLPVVRDTIINVTKRDKSDSKINYLLKVEKNSQKENEDVPEQTKLNGKILPSGSSLKMWGIQSSSAVVLPTVKNNIKQKITNQTRNISTKNNFGRRNDNTFINSISNKNEYNIDCKMVHSHSPSDKCIKSTKNLLRHIKRHVQNTQRNTPPVKKPEYRPKTTERMSKNVYPASVDDLRPLLLIVSTAKQMAYQMKGMLRPPKVEKYFSKERLNKNSKIENIKSQTSLNYGEQYKSAKKLTKNNYGEHCNTLKTNTKNNPQKVKKSYGSIKSQNEINPMMDEFYSKNTKSNKIINKKIQKTSLYQFPGAERLSFANVKANNELKTSLSDNSFSRKERKNKNESKKNNLAAEKMSQNKKYDPLRKLSTISYKKSNSVSREESEWEEKHSLSSVSREINLLRRRQHQESSLNNNSSAGKRTKNDNNYVENDNNSKFDDGKPKINIEHAEQKSKRVYYSRYHNNSGKENYTNSLNKPENSDKKLNLLPTKRKEMLQRNESRIWPELFSRIDKTGSKNSSDIQDSGGKSFVTSKYNNDASIVRSRFNFQGKVKEKNKSQFTGYFKERSISESKNIFFVNKTEPAERVSPMKNKPSTDNNNEHFSRLNDERSNAKQNNVPNVDENDVAKEVTYHEQRITKPLSQNNDVKSKFNDTSPLYLSLLSQTRGSNRVVGKDNNEVLRSINSIWENSGLKHYVSNPNAGQSIDYNNSFISANRDNNNNNHSYLKDKYVLENSTKYFKNPQAYSEQFASEKYDTIKNIQVAKKSSPLNIKESSPRSKSADSFTVPIEKKTEPKYTINIPNFGLETNKRLPTYEEFIEKNTAESTKKTRRFVQSLLDGQENTKINYTRSGFMKYFKNEFEKQSKWIGETENDRKTDFHKATFKRVSFNEPINKLKPSELTIKLKNFSSVPEIRNDVIVNHFSNRINQTKSKYCTTSSYTNEELNITEYEIKERNLLHNNMLKPSQMKKNKHKNSKNIFNEVIEKLPTEFVYTPGQRSFNNIKKEFIENEGDIFDKSMVEERVAETQGSVYKGLFAGTVVPERGNFELFMRNRNTNSGNMLERYFIDVPNLSVDNLHTDNLHTLTSTNHWFDDKNNVGSSISIPMTIQQTKSTRNYNK